ncbi:MAG: methyltransferase domain-containing protein [Candidatus Omnitrophica bacterium]|nr:Trans-aconitate 2-methyltransferase [bacterium]NUN95670.1 methyltransferase domain-containing protein [Candidatus Omnitrophota bacterium]
MSEGPENQGIYTGFARGYDRVMRDVDYPKWAQHILSLIRDFRFAGKRLLNLACGTGNMEVYWAAKGFQVTGIDRSEEMVEMARAKLPRGCRVRFGIGDMRTFDLGETFDLALCLYDSLNYLTRAREVQDCFRRVHSHLKAGGGFIFDVATETNILENFTQSTYAENFEDFAYIWDNEYNMRTKICRSDFHFFYRVGRSSRFERFSETHYQKIYATRDLIRWLEDAGFECLAVYDGISRDYPDTAAERIHFVARRI